VKFDLVGDLFYSGSPHTFLVHSIFSTFSGNLYAYFQNILLRAVSSPKVLLM